MNTHRNQKRHVSPETPVYHPAGEGPDQQPASKRRSARKKLVCIGTSTGGPRALQTVLASLPEGLPAPVLVVQHMPPGFTRQLANRLNSICRITVKEAEDGEIVQKGTAYIAPGDFHMKVREQAGQMVIQLEQSPTVSGHRPAVDQTFESISRLKHYDKVAVVMTGMGSDGTKGLIHLKNEGNVKVIAESKESCIVYGMPRSAIAANLVDEIKHLNDIADAIIDYISD
ncbi:chemotaxis protein CheB [Heyndrickxia acidiproducens]|uniref:chemotaxis protein CheB n=1 Tax=Heyndrickxia acidiproducens TaxID=1121084 RepID=UPI00037312F7|nr:chemotaxis protein CheB [Heyndrickxia acidiproducens]